MFSTLILTSRVRVSESTTRGGFPRAERLLWSCRSTQGVKRHVDPVEYYGSREGRRYYGLPTGVPCARHSRVLT